MRIVRTLLACHASVLAACASAPAPTTVASLPQPADTVYIVDTVSTVEANPELESRVARLEIMLLERDARIADLNRTLGETRQEVVRNLAKLQSQASRAEAASGLAEAELAVQALGRLPGARELSQYREAEARAQESSREFAAENFGGALYLANQARTLAAAARSRLTTRTEGDLRPGEAVFATPVPLQTTDQRVNVRGGPGLEYGVVVTLEPGSPVVGQSYTDEWVRVEDEAGRGGWIFHPLVKAREP